ncbi:hypothetical protein PAMP_016836 [Pampus punctatissimus]
MQILQSKRGHAWLPPQIVQSHPAIQLLPAKAPGQQSLDSEKHTDHRFRPVDEAARQHRKKLEETLEPLKKKLKVCERVKMEFDQTAEHIKFQAKHTEAQIKKQFEKLHQFLKEEEETRGAEESGDEGEDGGSEQRDSSSFTHSQSHRRGAES